MKYIKISPFDFFLLVEKDGLSHEVVIVEAKKLEAKRLCEITIHISGPGLSQPYSFKQPLIEYNGKIYLRASTVQPSQEAMDRFILDDPRSKELIEKMNARQAQQGEVIVRYEPESE